MQRIGAGLAAGASARLRAPDLALGALHGRLRHALALEAGQRRLFPWLAVAFGAGILVFFACADGRPVLPAPLAAGAACLLLATRLRRAAGGDGPGARPRFRLPRLLRRRVAGGARRRAGPDADPGRPAHGLIEALDEREEGARLIVRVESFGTLPPEARPLRVRVSFRKAPPLKPGATR